MIHVLSAEEINPDVTGDLRLIDCEDGDQAEITVSKPLLEKYQQTLAQFISSARTFCSQRSMTYMMVNTETPVQAFISQYLRSRGLVR